MPCMLTLPILLQRSIRTAPMHSNPPDNSRSGPHSQPDRKGPFKGVQDFEWRRIIGAGTFGRVCHCIVRDGPHAGQMVAIKSISKSFALCQGQVSHLKLEKSLLSLLQHRFIVSYYGSFQDEEFVYLVLEYVSGGEKIEGRCPFSISP